MDYMKKISVIIAAYNAEEYLSETLDSIFLQTMNDSEYEVIIINDGSSDSTLDILNSYKQTYSNLIIIDKENGGPSSARNAGLDIAKGEYVFFFDADDILEGDALSTMYETASEKQADLLIGKYDIFNRHTTIAIHNLDDLIELEEIDKYNTDILWTFSLSNKLFRRDLIEKFNLRLPPVSYSEDGAFLTQFLYRSSKIVGLDYIIFHYRRYDDMNSITASISPSKIRDYITAHQIILASAEESFLRDYPEYNTIEEAREQNSDIHNYLNTIIQKQLQIMLNQFYIQFWSLDSDTVQLLVDEINNKLKILDMRVISTLSLSFPEFSLYDIKASQEDVLKNAFFTAVLYGDLANKDNFIKSLDSLEKQNLIFMKIVVPSSMKTDIEKEGMLQGNLFFEDSNSKEELFVSALNNTQTPYITFCDAEIIYATGIFRFAYRQLIKQQYDFISEGIYHKEYEQPQPLLLSKIAYTSLRNGRKNNPCLSMDATLANKFFCVDFVRKLHLDFGKELPELIKLCYMEGYYLYRLDGMLLYNNRETTFIDYIATEKTLPFIKEYLKDKPITLNSPEILYAPAESGKKFRLLPDKTEEDQAWNKKAASFQKKPLKNQVLFVSPRADGHLEGNAKALYPFIKGKKVICAKRLPHDPETALEMTEVILTSKVIVTDDYVK